MNVFGIGFPEILFILVIALIILGPKNLVKTSRDISSAIRKFATSDTWKSIINSTQEIRNIQEKIIDDTGLKESINTLRSSTRDIGLPPSQSRWDSLKPGKSDQAENQNSENKVDQKPDDPVESNSNQDQAHS